MGILDHSLTREAKETLPVRKAIFSTLKDLNELGVPGVARQVLQVYIANPEAKIKFELGTQRPS